MADLQKTPSRLLAATINAQLKATENAVLLLKVLGSELACDHMGCTWS